MKILITSSEFPPGPGGIGNHAYNLAHRLHLLGWQVWVITPQDNAEPAQIHDFNAAQGFTITRLERGSNRLLDFFWHFFVCFNVFRKFNPDVLLTSGMRSAWLAGLLSRSLKIPWGLVAHGGVEFNPPQWARRVLTRKIYSMADAIISVSEYTHRQLLQAGVSAPKMQVIVNGADELSHSPMPGEEIAAWKKSRGFEKSTLLLTVGSVSDRKGQEIVIRAMPIIRQSIPNAQYLMAGVPAIKPRLQALAKELGVADSVHFLGSVRREELAHAYNACDIFLMTSQHSSDGDFEGFGIAVIEAALYGKPAVVSGQSGLAEAVLHGITGIHVPEGSPEETAQAVLRLLLDDAGRNRMGKMAYERAVGEYTWTKKAYLYADFLNDMRVVEKKP